MHTPYYINYTQFNEVTISIQKLKCAYNGV